MSYRDRYDDRDRGRDSYKSSSYGSHSRDDRYGGGMDESEESRRKRRLEERLAARPGRSVWARSPSPPPANIKKASALIKKPAEAHKVAPIIETK